MDVSHNQLTSLAGLEGCAGLATLLCSDNALASADALLPLATCTSLQSIDLRRNKLCDFEGVLRVLTSLPHLRCLYLEDNPLVSGTANYRRRLVAALRGLTYLDDRPVFKEERRRAQAWCIGGSDDGVAGVPALTVAASLLELD